MACKVPLEFLLNDDRRLALVDGRNRLDALAAAGFRFADRNTLPPGEFASGPARMFDPKGKDREAKANLQIAQGRGGTAPYHELREVAGDYLALFRELTRHWPDDLRDTCNRET
jgi:hypothetical protein